MNTQVCIYSPVVVKLDTDPAAPSFYFLGKDDPHNYMRVFVTREQLEELHSQLTKFLSTPNPTTSATTPESRKDTPNETNP
jgi:hypothetical protein